MSEENKTKKESIVVTTPPDSKNEAKHQKLYSNATKRTSYSYNIQTATGDTKTKHIEVVEFGKSKNGKSLATKHYLRGMDKNGKRMYNR